MNLDAGQLRSLRQARDGQWRKLSGFCQAELVDLGLVRLVTDIPIITPHGAKQLKENA